MRHMFKYKSLVFGGFPLIVELSHFTQSIVGTIGKCQTFSSEENNHIKYSMGYMAQILHFNDMKYYIVEQDNIMGVCTNILGPYNVNKIEILDLPRGTAFRT